MRKTSSMFLYAVRQASQLAKGEYVKGLTRGDLNSFHGFRIGCTHRWLQGSKKELCKSFFDDRGRSQQSLRMLHSEDMLKSPMVYAFSFLYVAFI